MLWSVLEANRLLGTRIRLDVVSRDPEAFARREPEIAAQAEVRLRRGDVTDPIATGERYDAIVHAATPARADLLRDAPHQMLEIILRGSRNVAELAEFCGSVPTLFTSSGAVYGRSGSADDVSETSSAAPDPTDAGSAYAEGKRCGELMCAIAAERSRGRAVIARLFAFVGPYLPLDRHFAIGNFLGDRLAGRNIEVGGDGTAIRSYLYALDMVVWLWALFARAPSRRAYNVGSDFAIGIADLARRIAALEEPGLSVDVAGTAVAGRRPDRYVPSNERIRAELGVVLSVDLDEACRRTLQHHRQAAETIRR